MIDIIIVHVFLRDGEQLREQRWRRRVVSHNEVVTQQREEEGVGLVADQVALAVGQWNHEPIGESRRVDRTGVGVGRRGDGQEGVEVLDRVNRTVKQNLNHTRKTTVHTKP